MHPRRRSSFFFFNDTATTEIYTLSLHDALPISLVEENPQDRFARYGLAMELSSQGRLEESWGEFRDRKSTRLNSSHLVISYAVFCLKKNSSCALSLGVSVCARISLITASMPFTV